MFQARWIAFQIAVAMLTFWWIGTWANLREFGIAPAVVSMFVAFVATGLLIRLLDRRSGVVRVAQKPKRNRLVLPRIVGLGEATKQITRVRIGKNIRKLP